MRAYCYTWFFNYTSIIVYKKNVKYPILVKIYVKYSKTSLFFTNNEWKNKERENKKTRHQEMKKWKVNTSLPQKSLVSSWYPKICVFLLACIFSKMVRAGPLVEKIWLRFFSVIGKLLAVLFSFIFLHQKKFFLIQVGQKTERWILESYQFLDIYKRNGNVIEKTTTTSHNISRLISKLVIIGTALIKSMSP